MADATTVEIACIAIPKDASEIPFSIVDAFWERSETTAPGAQFSKYGKGCLTIALKYACRSLHVTRVATVLSRSA